MASLILGLAYLTSESVKKAKEKRREAKRKGYEERYAQLEAEHEKYKAMSPTTTGSTQHEKLTPSKSNDLTTRRSSSESRRSSDADLSNNPFISRKKG